MFSFHFMFKAKEAADLAAQEAQKAGHAIDTGVNQAAAVVDNTKNTVNNTVQQVNTVAANSKQAAANIAEASQKVRIS